MKLFFSKILGPSHYDRSETTKKFDADDEDLDAMINSLKQKTSGRQGNNLISQFFYRFFF